jgi:hypothetical protein
LNDDQWNRLRTFLDRAQERMRPRNDGGNQRQPQQRPQRPMPRRRP